MKILCLSLWQPWASVLFRYDTGGRPFKKDETRPWSTHVRGWIAIHAAKQQPDWETRNYYSRRLHEAGLEWTHLPYGKIIGLVNLEAVHQTQDIVGMRSADQVFWGDYRQFGDDDKQRHALQFGARRKFLVPLSCLGRQKFFNVEIPDELYPGAVA